MSKQQIGVIGMAVMGKNLALNIESKNYHVSIFNRTRSITEEIANVNKDKNIFPYFSIKSFIDSLKKPRCIILMVKSGNATDQTIESILPYLEKGDILIDGGNTFYKDTIRRCDDLLKKAGIHFIGMGVSGGEFGALYGPSIMPGGSKKAYELVSCILHDISAKFKGESCVTYIGPNGSGHYVKMIHNGIEYGDMQLIAESYFILKNLLGLNNEELSNIFDEWNKGELNSYLIEITKDIFVKKDENNNYLLDVILDEAEDKGTGKWISKNALDFREPLSLITESVFSRYLSSIRNQRVIASKILTGPSLQSTLLTNKVKFIEEVRKALYLGKIISYAQGFAQLRKASEKYSWNLKYSKIAKIFRAGCIIRASFLEKIADAFNLDNNIKNLLLTPYFSKISNEYEKSLRKIVIYGVKYGISMPAFSSAISYYDSYRTISSSANLIQAQRDYFGAHTYKRIDKIGYFHTNWLCNKK